ncbi:hypothetical protein KKB18_01630, partial [bacterium]|nr:hypothetical protein [bacterium]
INLDRSGTADFQYTRIMQDITKSDLIINTLKRVDNNIQGATGWSPWARLRLAPTHVGNEYFRSEN